MIRRFYAHNFRCLENFELSLDGSPSVLLLGRNGTGKSTVGAALRRLQKIARGINRVGDLVVPTDLAKGRADAPIRFELEVVLEGDVYTYSIAFEFPPGFRELRVLNEQLKVSGQSVFSRELSDVRILRSGSIPEVKFGVDWHVVALPVVYEQSARDPLSVFRTWLSNSLILHPVPSLFRGVSDAQGSHPMMIDPEGINIGDWFTSVTGAAPDSYALIHGHLTNVMPEFNKISNQLVGRGTRNLLFHFMKGVEKIELEIDQLSDGEKCFVLQALVMATCETRSPLLCFWDEPDNFLAPDEIGQSIMGLRRAFQNNGQFIVTSHNPETIRRFSEENTFCLSRKSRLEPTTFKTVKAMRESGDYSGSFIDALLRGDIGAGDKR